MAKKKTNAAKKKQVTKAKKNRLSSAYGVSVLKGGTKSRNKGVIDAKSTSLDDGNSQAKNPIGTSTNSEGKTKNTFSMPTLGMMSNQGTRISHFESDEFKRQHASLEERSLALQARKVELLRIKKVRTQRHKRGWGKLARPSATNFARATLTLAPKTSQELVDDATNHVALGMAGIGQRASIPLDASAMQGRSSLAAASGLDWKLRASTGTIQPNVPQHQNNPYAALDIDSDSDVDCVEVGNTSMVTQQLLFNPASFSFKSTVSSPKLPRNNDDIDPDL
jgi:hypothetical protein